MVGVVELEVVEIGYKMEQLILVVAEVVVLIPLIQVLDLVVQV